MHLHARTTSCREVVTIASAAATTCSMRCSNPSTSRCQGTVVRYSVAEVREGRGRWCTEQRQQAHVRRTRDANAD